jgi:subtilisin family serine protease
MPWLALGALGSPFDLLLAAAVGAAFALFAAAAYRAGWLPSLTLDRRGPRRDLFTGGSALGVALLIMASGYGAGGVQLLLMVSLPALGWAAAGSRLGLLLGLVAAVLLACVDGNALPIVTADIQLGAYFLAAGITVVLGWLAGALVIRLSGRTRGATEPIAAANRAPDRTALVTGAAVLLWLVAAGIYLGLGQPGFFGDRLFVILDTQVDVRPAAAIQEYDARRRMVYTTLVEHAERTQAPLTGTLERLRIGYTPYYLVNALEVHGGLPLRLWLERQPGVDRVLPSPRLRPLPWPLPIANGDASAPSAPAWNLTAIGATRVQRELGIDGSGIVIGQSDSGVQVDHPEFADRYRGRTDDDYNWLDPWYTSPAPVDHGGHGTHTLGSILGATTGVAPGASWFACANLARNLGNPALYLDCMQFMLAPYPQGGDAFHDGDPTRAAHVLNNSWGCPQEYEGCDPASLLPAVRALTAAGIFVVASAGNEGPDCGTVEAPIAIYDEVLSVGALSEEGNLAYFSSTGPVTVDGSHRIKPVLLAPGVEILSAFPNSTYGYSDGTSMAGPHVTGVVALMWSANPALIGDIATTERILEETAQPFRGGVEPLLPTPPNQEPPSDGLPGGEASSSWATPRIPIQSTPGEPDTLPPGGPCLDQIDPASVPNPAAGYGIVDAYAAVRASLDLARER